MTKLGDDTKKQYAVMEALNTVWDDFDLDDAETVMRALVKQGYLVMKL